MQKTVDIAETDTLGSLYFDQLYPLGVEAMLEAVDQVRDGTAPKVPQNEEEATYEGWCRKEQVEIDWSQPLETVCNLIRGADPQPGAWSTHGGQELQIYEARRLPGTTDGQPGEITAVDEESFSVAASRRTPCRPAGAALRRQENDGRRLCPRRRTASRDPPGKRLIVPRSYPAVAPPSTGSATPVTNDASSDNKKSAALAISSGLPGRPMGTRLCRW